jgi:serine/threonine-protein kinase
VIHREFFKEYDLITKIGGGGLSEIYLAQQPALEREVALKVLRYGVDSRSVERFWCGVKSLASLKHPNIVSVYEAGTHEGRYFLSMEHIPGNNLYDLSQTGANLEIPYAVTLFTKILDTVDAMHQQGVLHRDLKNTNIVVDKQDNPHLIDFDIAKPINLEISPEEKQFVLGTVGYMAPERIRVEATSEQDPRTDIFSVGVMLYEVLTLSLPYESDTGGLIPTPDSIIKKPHEFNCNVPRELDEICLRALAFNPDDRFPTAGEFSSVLAEFLKKQ